MTTRRPDSYLFLKPLLWRLGKHKDGDVLKPSLGHRLFRVRLGHAPSKLFALSDCSIQLDIFFGVQGALFIAAMVCWRVLHLPWPLSVLLLGLVGLLLAVEAAFKDCERFAQARIRRGECVRCGAKSGTPHLMKCQIGP